MVQLVCGVLVAAAAAGVDQPPRDERQEPLVLPDVGLLVPVVLAPEAAVTNHQRGVVGGATEGEELQHVLVEGRHR